MAEVLDISQSQYSKLENGEATFDIQKLSELIDQLEINPLDVIEFSDKQQTFINSAMSGNHNSSHNYNNSFNNYDEEMIRNIIHFSQCGNIPAFGQASSCLDYISRKINRRGKTSSEHEHQKLQRYSHW